MTPKNTVDTQKKKLKVPITRKYFYCIRCVSEWHYMWFFVLAKGYLEKKLLISKGVKTIKHDHFFIGFLFLGINWHKIIFLKNFIPGQGKKTRYRNYKKYFWRYPGEFVLCHGKNLYCECVGMCPIIFKKLIQIPTESGKKYIMPKQKSRYNNFQRIKNPKLYRKLSNLTFLRISRFKKLNQRT